MPFEPEKITYGPVAVGILAVSAVLYGLIIAQQLLVGLVAALLLVLVYLGWRLLHTTERIPDGNEYATAVITLLAGLVLLYSLVVAQQVLLGTLAALLVLLTYGAWQYLRAVERTEAQP